MGCQPLIFGKQLARIERLVGQVDVVITDSPILLSAVYGDKYPESFKRAIVDIFNSFDNLNYFIGRVKPYVPIGRRQSEESALAMDEKIIQFLNVEKIWYYGEDGNKEGVKNIVSKITNFCISENQQFGEPNDN